MPSQDNIVMYVKGPSTLQKPSENESYLFSHLISIIICASTTSIMVQLPRLLHMTPQSIPIPTDPLIHLNDRNNALKTRS